MTAAVCWASVNWVFIILLITSQPLKNPSKNVVVCFMVFSFFPPLPPAAQGSIKAADFHLCGAGCG